jgi:hypothetical protein
MDRRVTSVELRPISLLTTAEVNAAVATPETLDPGPDTVVGGLTAPNQYRAVTEGYYYPGRMTGSSPRVELYFTTRPGIFTNNTIRISGIHNLIDGSTAVGLAISGDFKALASDSPPWEDRPDYNGVRHTPGENVVTAILFDPNTGTEYSDRKPIIVKSRIASTEATTTTAKITFTSTNYFKVGDAVYVEMPQSSPYFGIDGLFRVKEVGSNFITFDFSSAIASPIASASVTEERYVYAVAQAAVRDGATWIDTRGDVDTVYVWKDIRWVTYSTGDVTKDTLAPSPVTALTATNENDTPDGNAIGLSRINLTWVAPTTNSDGTTLDDLVGYTIWWRQYESQDWSKVDTTGNEVKWSGTGFEQGANAYFRVFARDSGGNLSTGVGLTHSVNRTPPAIFQPNLPIVTTYLGTIKVAYDDLTVSGAEQADTAKEVEVYFDRNENFVPGPDSYYGKFAAGNRSYIIIPGTDQRLSNGDGVDFYFRIIVRDIYGNITAPSDPPVSIRAKLSDIVTYDMIDVGTLTGRVIIGADIRTSDNPSATGGIILNEQQLIAYNDEGEETFRISADNGAVSIGDYLGKEDAAGLYLGQLDAASTYSTKIEANAIELKATNAAQSAADAQDTADESITRIEAGEIKITKAKAVGAINEGVDNGNTTTISGGVITTNSINAEAISTGEFRSGVVYSGTINASQINAGSISADRLTSTSLNASNITSGTLDANKMTVSNLTANKIAAGTLTGSTVQTSDGSPRVTMSSTGNSFNIFNSANQQVGTISGGSTSGVGLNIQANTTNTAESIKLFSGGITIAGDNTRIQLYPTRTRSAATIVMDADRVSFPSISGIPATNGNASVLQISQSGTALNKGAIQGTDLTGTTTRTVQVTSGGYLRAPSSDRRIKQNIEPLLLGLNLISKLNPQKFQFKSSPGELEYGLIAQDVREALQQLDVTDKSTLVYEDTSKELIKQLPEGEEGPVLGIEYMRLIPILINSVKELQARVEFLENKEGDN